MSKLQYEVVTINKVLQYLGDQPYVKVRGLIQELQAGEMIEDTPPEPTPEEE